MLIGLLLFVLLLLAYVVIRSQIIVSIKTKPLV
jgi:hypothetical protein